MSEHGEIRGIFQGDIIIKTAIELAIGDLRKNPWVIEDIFSSLIENPLLKEKYGLKEVNRAKEFILNNEIFINMNHRIDEEFFPAITIGIGNSQEDDTLATLGDQSHIIEDLYPDEINQPIRFLIPPFNAVSYDKDTGIIEAPEDIEDTKYIAKDMVAVDPATGNGFIILEGQVGNNGFKITPGSELPDGQIAIIPQYQLYRARRERAISQETYNIGCHCHGDPSTLIFLFAVVKYALFRYREALLEHENFQLSRISCTDMIENQQFKTEKVYSRFITIKGQVEESWVKAPYRVIEAMELSDPSEDNELLQKGIRILSQDPPEGMDTSEDLWVTVDDE